ncbi:MAG: WbuC family cupin fold metalloprotein [Verrucomicrobiae bacterium]|nr:WbuC family cupin fold metalloprotein [Verrucomicrobiae bacterium]
MNYRPESDAVLYASDPVVLLNGADLGELKALARQNPRKTIRICTHRTTGDALHEMIIVLPKGFRVRPHKHLGKAESFSILEGEVEVVLFDDLGRVTRVIPMGPPSSGKPFYYRLADPVFHTVIPRSDPAVFHEITQGPFIREQTVFADWDWDETCLDPV